MIATCRFIMFSAISELADFSTNFGFYIALKMFNSWIFEHRKKLLTFIS